MTANAAVERWHLFHNGRAAPHFGFGTLAQAQGHWAMLHDRGALDAYVLTTFDEGENPPDGALLVDLDTGDFLPERFASKPTQL